MAQNLLEILTMLSVPALSLPSLCAYGFRIYKAISGVYDSIREFSCCRSLADPNPAFPLRLLGLLLEDDKPGRGRRVRRRNAQLRACTSEKRRVAIIDNKTNNH